MGCFLEIYDCFAQLAVRPLGPEMKNKNGRIFTKFLVIIILI